MRVNVDETGRHDLTFHIDHALGAVGSVLFDGRNPSIADCHIRRARRPVDDRAALDQNIVHRSVPPRSFSDTRAGGPRDY